MQQHAFEDVRVTSKMHAPHATRFIEMRKRAFEPLAALSQQAFAARAANPSAISIDGVARLRVFRPVAAATIGFGDVPAHADRLEIDELPITVIPLVRDDLVESLAFGRHGLDLFSGLNQRLDARGRVTLIRSLHRDRHDRASVQVDRVLDFVRQMRPPVFHLGDFRVGIERMRPIVVRPFLRSLPVDARQVLACGGVDAGRLRKLRQKLLIRGAGVTPHDAAQRRVRFQCGCVNANRFPFDQAGVGEPLQNPREHRFVGFQIDQPARARNRRMIGRRVRQHQPEKLAQRKRVRGTPRDGALGVQAFEVTDQQQSEIASGRQARSADLVSVESLTERLDIPVEIRFVENLIESRVERVRRGAWQIVCRDPHRRLLRTVPVVCPSPCATV
jgi:hypothetical protein